MTPNMRAAELAAPGAALRMVSRPIPVPGPGEVRVRVEACGVCGSDVFLQKGGFSDAVTWPVIPGHEAAGIVDAVGDGVTAISPGDQVALYYISVPPGDPWAARGRPNISPYVTRMGVDVDGAFADYVLRPVEALIRPPAPVPSTVLAVLTDAVATPLHGLKRVAHLQPGETLVVLGVGGLGSNAVQLGKASAPGSSPSPGPGPSSTSPAGWGRTRPSLPTTATRWPSSGRSPAAMGQTS